MSSAYARDVSGIAILDPYRLQELYRMHPCAEHVVKKLLVAGEREGGKSLDHDISDCIRTLTRWQEMRAEDKKPEVGTPDEAEPVGKYSVRGRVPDRFPVGKYSVWGRVPDRFQWIATDCDGETYAYEVEPHLGGTSWHYEGRNLHLRIHDVIPPNCHWSKSLERRP